MPGQPAYVIVGASLAGAKAAETLREEGFDGAVVMIGEETDRPYERPPLSKGYLLGNDERESIFVHPEGWYAENDVDLRLGAPATSVDRSGRTVSLANGESVPYDKLLITTGASPAAAEHSRCRPGRRALPASVENSERLAAALRGGGSVVIAGAGWIGLETAAAARQYGCEVTVVEPERGALLRSIGPELGEVFADLHRSHGVTFRFGEGAQRDHRLRRGGRRGHLRRHRAARGRRGHRDRRRAEHRPRRRRRPGGGQRHPDRRGAAHLRPGHLRRRRRGNSFNPLLGRRIRVEHWGNALTGGPAAARSMLGQAGLLRPGAVLLQRPVRPRHGRRRAARARQLRRDASTGATRSRWSSSRSGCRTAP